MNRPTLRGDRNQCAGCDQCFNSTHAFDKHRVGEHGIDRRCLSEDEMQAKGMVLREDGFWRGSAMPGGLVVAMTYEDETAALVAEDARQAPIDASVAMKD